MSQSNDHSYLLCGDMFIRALLSSSLFPLPPCSLFYLLSVSLDSLFKMSKEEDYDFLFKGIVLLKLKLIQHSLALPT